jgi:hypothetical protein
MNVMSKLGLATALLLLGVAFSASDTRAQSIKDVVGTYTLVSAITEQGGSKTEVFGPGAKGVLSLDSSGRYALVITAADVPKFASNNRMTGTAEENKAVVAKSIAHFGTYSISEADKTINFKIESATFANWNATEQKRNFTLSGDELKYSVAAASGGGTATVTWKRSK